ncbi:MULTISPECIES: threonine--tRNA ligase [Vibrio]|uniref:threonine--tRNA ligase n=1 Tax=Vibrio TaxID=662 RepID=UPI0001B95A40|nr:MULTISPECIES: threonine--tRNA ligase [Vibrio]EEX34389.1 threonyl-tRNA synthetase [Vibrio coralliilyticus ATCC BAA-450]MCM5510101.1 threonine--tRNA ligase [Vibrio sp. SCSIO 43169]MDE3898435.1 threonine--tRNA ligase [Vibrio sp. CC007]
MINEHRKIGKQLKLFDISESVSGMVDWYPKGHELYRKVQAYIRSVQKRYGYHEVRSPVLANHSVWTTSGHNEKYGENMFHVPEHNLSVKPMSCPFHISMFNELVSSYRELPYRIAEFGLCHRNESSGSLNGLFRLRAFNQDDGHIFCQEQQIKDELKHFCAMLFEMYEHFGFSRKDISVKISLRPKNKIGSDELWSRSELYLQEGLDELGIGYELLPGEGAFYGAKVEFSLKDSLDRHWQCGTFQLDFFLSEKFDSSFINELGDSEYPVVLHRAALGSLERFIAILLEHYKGRLPVQFNPYAVVLVPLTVEHQAYCHELQEQLGAMGIACIIDDSDNSVGYRVRQSYKMKCNYLIVIGDDELKSDVLGLKSGKDVKEVSREHLSSFFIEQSA